jgi:hypothetical protein
VSGSIVIAGNTIHWIETQGKCPETATKKAISTLIMATKVFGGKVVETTSQLVEWLEEQFQEYEPIEYEEKP